MKSQEPFYNVGDVYTIFTIKINLLNNLKQKISAFIRGC